MLKRRQFGDGGSDEKEPRKSKRQRLDECDDEEKNGLDEDKYEIEGGRYISLPLLS